MNEIIEKGYAKYPRYQVEHQLMTNYGIYLIMEFIIQQNPIKSALYLTAVLSMMVDLSTKSFWLDLTLLIRLLVSSSDLGKKKLLLLQT